MVGITKGHPALTLQRAAAVGMDRIGENRVAEASAKKAEVGSLGLQWHMVGHLQRNKVAAALPVFDVIESVDSLRLARRLAQAAERAQREALEVLVQVNTSGEATKGGFTAADFDPLREVCTLDRLRVVGLMTMAPLTEDERTLRATFRATRELFERCAAEVEGFEPRVLSMGMSNDFELAIEEGATRVRLGTVLFGERMYDD